MPRKQVERRSVIRVRDCHLSRDHVAVSASVDGVPTVVAVDWTACNYGGARPWFRCPDCGTRRQNLYAGSAGRLSCRECLNLAYWSQNHGKVDRAYDRAFEIRRSLGGPGNVVEPFPPKPKWMRWRTYWRRHRECLEAEAVGLRYMAAALDRWRR